MIFDADLSTTSATNIVVAIAYCKALLGHIALRLMLARQPVLPNIGV